jgi:hypothetical protein
MKLHELKQMNRAIDDYDKGLMTIEALGLYYEKYKEGLND